jgi:hypothetical protein
MEDLNTLRRIVLKQYEKHSFGKVLIEVKIKKALPPAGCGGL